MYCGPIKLISLMSRDSHMQRLLFSFLDLLHSSVFFLLFLRVRDVVLCLGEAYPDVLKTFLSVLSNYS